ncbi:hypothetical protein SHIRM173S_10328 [Streptomyces hirsutus]
MESRGLAAFRSGDVPAALRLFDEAEERYAKLGTPTFMLDIRRCEVLMAAGLPSEALAGADAAVKALDGIGGQSTRKAELLLAAARAARLADDPQTAIARAALAVRLFAGQRRTWWETHARLVLIEARHAAGRGSGRLVAEAATVADRLAALGALGRAGGLPARGPDRAGPRLDGGRRAASRGRRPQQTQRASARAADGLGRAGVAGAGGRVRAGCPGGLPTRARRARRPPDDAGCVGAAGACHRAGRGAGRPGPAGEPGLGRAAAAAGVERTLAGHRAVHAAHPAPRRPGAAPWNDRLPGDRRPRGGGPRRGRVRLLLRRPPRLRLRLRLRLDRSVRRPSCTASRAHAAASRTSPRSRAYRARSAAYPAGTGTPSATSQSPTGAGTVRTSACPISAVRAAARPGRVRTPRARGQPSRPQSAGRGP